MSITIKKGMSYAERLQWKTLNEPFFSNEGLETPFYCEDMKRSFH